MEGFKKETIGNKMNSYHLENMIHLQEEIYTYFLKNKINLNHLHFDTRIDDVDFNCASKSLIL